MNALTRTQLASMLDSTLLAADATAARITQLCAEAIALGIGAVYVNPTRVALAASLLQGTPVQLGSVTGFPLGATLPAVKAFEARQVVDAAAQTVDMVLNVGALKDGNFALVEEDVRQVVEAVAPRATVKVILETCLLTDDEIQVACRLCEAAGAHFVKTSTGLSSGGATVGHVRLLRASVSSALGVKAAGGIRDYAIALQMAQAGATRLGTSAAAAILAAVPAEF